MPLLFTAANSESATPASVLGIISLSSVSVFALYKTSSNVTNDQYIFHVPIAANNNQRLALRVNGSTNFRWGGRRLDGGANSSVNATPAPAANTLYALTGRWNYATNARDLSVDGSTTTSNYSSAGTSDAGTPSASHIGRSSAGTSTEYCDGTLYTLMFWADHVLTDAERDLLRNGAYDEAIASAGTPLYWWKLNDAVSGSLTSGQAVDSGSGGNNLGPGANAPTWISPLGPVVSAARRLRQRNPAYFNQ